MTGDNAIPTRSSWESFSCEFSDEDKDRFRLRLLLFPIVVVVVVVVSSEMGDRDVNRDRVFRGCSCSANIVLDKWQQWKSTNDKKIARLSLRENRLMLLGLFMVDNDVLVTSMGNVQQHFDCSAVEKRRIEHFF